MNISDEELQKKILSGHAEGDSLNEITYRKVFDALRKEPYVLPVDFADTVMTKIRYKSDLSRDYFWFGAGLLLFALAAVIAGFTAGVQLNFRFSLYTGYSGLFVFALTLILLIHFIDKRLIQPKLRS